MTIKELIEKLEEFDQNKNVQLGSPWKTLGAIGDIVDYGEYIEIEYTL